MSRIILPLDGFGDFSQVEKLVTEIKIAESLLNKELIWGFKVNDLLIDQGIYVVRFLREKGYKVFADPKLFDIPNTIHNSLLHLIEVGADIISVHCSADYESRLNEVEKIAGITVLTSMSETVCQEIYGGTIEEIVNQFAILARNRNYGYCVCSARDFPFLPDMGDTKVICPGIRPEWYQNKDDQKRVMTPAEAIEAGADLLVIGRPILNAEDRVKALVRTNEEIHAAELKGE